MAKTAPAPGKAAPASAAPTHAPSRSDVIAALADDILQHYSEGRVIVAIDGMDGAGKTEFADALAAHLRIGNRSVFRASIDDFHRPRIERYARGKDSAEGFYRDSFNYRTFQRVLIDPFRIGHYGSFVLQAFDLSRDAAFEPKWSSGPDDAILIVDGIFLNRPELKGIWNYSVWLEVDRKVAEARMRARDGESANPERYTEGQKLYLKEAKPQAAASAIIDNNDFDHPRRIFADSC
jgi:uridine kinase